LLASSSNTEDIAGGTVSELIDDKVDPNEVISLSRRRIVLSTHRKPTSTGICSLGSFQL
jgi:hypothetical protein